MALSIAPASNVPSSISSQPQPDDKLSNTDRLIALIDQVTAAMENAIGDIRQINANTKLLALNARIEAARSGSQGAAFGVVAQEMQTLSGKTTVVADSLANKTQASIAELVTIIGRNVRGTRLADAALNCVDLVDRNLYERTCDVRWWATDAAIVSALERLESTDLQHASQRMGVILNAYTVYHDLVICDRDGKVVANGRPDLYSSAGMDFGQAPWFREAMHSASGDEYSFQGPVASPLVHGQPSLIYACGVREGGVATNPPIGVLGVIFRWDSFAKVILDNLPIDKVEKDRTLGLIIKSDGSLVAASKILPSDYRFPCEKFAHLLVQSVGYTFDKFDGKDACIAHGIAPGFETYTTGWHAILIQE